MNHSSCSKIVVIGVLGLLFAATQNVAILGVVHQKSDLVAQKPTEGLYYGTTSEGSSVRPWFVWLAARDRRGTMYLPPGVQPLTGFTLSSTGTISFESVSFDITYKFTGNVTADGIQGELSILPPMTAASRNAVTLTHLTVPMAPNANSRPTGVFSNAVVNDQTGDLNGIEMMIIEDGRRVIGAYTDFQNGYAPEALSETVAIRGGFRFALRGEALAGQYSVTFENDGVLLRRPTGTARSVIRLKRRATLQDAFQVSHSKSK